MESGNLQYEGILNVIDQALAFVAPAGQIRMTTLAGIQEHSGHFERRLRLKGHLSVTVEGEDHDGLLVVRRQLTDATQFGAGRRARA
jgi:hypothetical protein